jgi:hypothetical protein
VECIKPTELRSTGIRFHSFNFKEEISEVLHLVPALHVAETWTLRKEDKKYLESFEL